MGYRRREKECREWCSWERIQRGTRYQVKEKEKEIPRKGSRKKIETPSRSDFFFLRPFPSSLLSCFIPFFGPSCTWHLHLHL